MVTIKRPPETLRRSSQRLEPLSVRATATREDATANGQWREHDERGPATRPSFDQTPHQTTEPDTDEYVPHDIEFEYRGELGQRRGGPDGERRAERSEGEVEPEHLSPARGVEQDTGQ